MPATINIERLFDQKYRDISTPFPVDGGFDSSIGPSAKDYGAVGDGVQDDTAALARWINAINAAATGQLVILPGGQYLTKAPLPPITQTGVSIMGAGWAQTADLSGSVITAASGYSGGPVMTFAAEGTEIRSGVTLDGSGRASTCCAVTAKNCRLTDMSCRGVAAGGVALDIQSGGASAWISDCRINGINYPNTGIQVADTDIIITNCKPTNSTYNIVLLSGADGALITDNHMTPGATNGWNCIWVNGNPSHVVIDSNRFDNYTRSGIQITPPASTPNSIAVTNNHFHSAVQTDNTYALVALDTTLSGVRGLHIVGNSGYGSASHRPKWGLAAQVQDGTTPTNTSRLGSLGSTFNSNTFWAATANFGNANPTIARGNLSTTDGTTYAAVTDI